MKKLYEVRNSNYRDRKMELIDEINKRKPENDADWFCMLEKAGVRKFRWRNEYSWYKHRLPEIISLCQQLDIPCDDLIFEPIQIGKQYSELIPIECVSSNPLQKCSKWYCRCNCGETCITTGFNLYYGIAKTCGHAKRESHEARYKLVKFESVIRYDELFENYSVEGTSIDYSMRFKTYEEAAECRNRIEKEYFEGELQ